MKKLISIALTLAVLLSVVSVGLTSNASQVMEDGLLTKEESAAPITFEPAEDSTEISAPPIRFEWDGNTKDNYKGYVGVHNGKFVIIGTNPKTNKPNAETFTSTKGITGKALQNFSLKYKYNTGSELRRELVDGIYFHTPTDTDIATPASCYSVLVVGRRIMGSAQGVAGGATKNPAICITKNAEISASMLGTAVKDDATGFYKHDKGVYVETPIATDTDYYIEVEVKGTKVEVYVYSAKEAKPAQPTIYYEDADLANTSGDIAFTARSTGCTYSEITLKDTTNDKTIANKYSPNFYNSAEYKTFVPSDTNTIASFIKNGNMVYTDKGYRFYTKSIIDGNHRPVTSSIVKAPFNDTMENYDLSFEYIHNASDTTASVLLNSANGVAESSPLTLNLSDTSIELLEGTTSADSAEFTFDPAKTYQVKVKKTALNVKVWIYEKGTEPSATPTIDAPLSKTVKQGAVYFHTEKGDFTVNNIIASATDGYYDVRDGKFVIAGKTTCNGDTIILTKGITGEDLTDFTMEYTFNTAAVSSNRNFISLGIDRRSPHPSAKYIVSISNTTKGGKTVAVPCILKSGTNITKHAAATAMDLEIQSNTDYRIKIQLSATNKKMQVWVWKLGDNMPTAPTMELAENGLADVSGDIAIGCRGNAYSLSDITIINDAEDRAICTNYSPIVYNSDSAEITNKVATMQTSGTVTYTDEGFRFNATSSFDGGVRPVSSAGLIGSDVFGNFELSVDYIPNSDIGANKILFNSTGPSGSGFSLSLSADKVALFENGGQLDSKDIALSVGKAYTVDISRLDYSIEVYIYEKGTDKPATPTIKYTDVYPLGKGHIYFHTDNGDFTLNAISLKITDTSTQSNAITDKHTVYSQPEITFEKAKSDRVPSAFTEYGGGIVNIRDGRVVFSGYTELIDGINDGKSSSLWVLTKGITGKKLEDYTLKYNYIPSSNTYSVDTVILRTDDSDNPTRTKGYAFGVQGSAYQQNFGNKPMIWIRKDSGDRISDDPAGLDPAANVYKEIDLEIGAEYIVEITVADCKIDAWLYKADEEKPAQPTITYTDADKTYKSGDISFMARDEGFSISDITLVDVTNNKTIVKDYAPSVYNNEKLDFTNISAGKLSNGKVTGSTYMTGTVSLNNGKLHLSNENGVEKTTYTTSVVTNPLVYGGDQYFDNFELCFVAAFADKDQNCIDVHFNNYPHSTEYKLSLDKGTSTVSLYKGTTRLAAAEYIFKTGFDYQVILSKTDGKMDVYIYKVGTAKPEPWLSFTDNSPLAKGAIFFGTDKGDFTLDQIALKVNDAAQVGNPFYELDFEDGMEDAILLNGSYELVQEDGNTYLKVTKDTSGDGKSLMIFGPRGVEDFTINMDVRITDNNNGRWFYFDLRHHTNGPTLGDSYHSQILQQGTQIAANHSELGYTVANYKLGLSGTANKTSGYPMHDYDAGLHNEGEWHRVSVVSDGYTISVYIDGKLKVSATDAEKLFKNGGFAIYTHGVSYDIDNIRIHSEPYYALKNDLIQLGPTGLIFEKNFEGDDCNMDGLNQTMGTKDKTVITTDKDTGNHFLRVVGARNGAPTDFSGVNAQSLITFGSNYVRNFDLTAKVSFRSAFGANWSYLTVGFRADFSKMRNEAVWFDIAPRGSTLVMKRDDLGFTSTSNLLAVTGNVKASGQTAYIPDDNRNCGIPLDGRWHEVKVSARGFTYTLYIDGKMILTYTDPEQLYERGAVYLYGYGINYDLDDIKLTNYDAYTPKTDPTNIVVYDNAEGFQFSADKVSNKLLSSAGVKDSKVANFEWQMDYKADSRSSAATSLLFTLTKDAETANSSDKFGEIKNVFALTIKGSGSPTSGLQNNAITVLTPDQDPLSKGELLPITFDKDTSDPNKTVNVPKTDSYLSLASTETQPPVVMDRWMTLNVRLVGNKLYVSVWQTDNKEATFRRQLFTLPYETLNKLAEGDFAISNGDQAVSIRNITIKDLDIPVKRP